MKYYIIFFLFFYISNSLKADHAMSLDIQLECLDFSLRKYKIRAIAYVDCGGLSPTGSMALNFNPRHPNTSTNPAERCITIEAQLAHIQTIYNVLPLCNNLPQDCSNAGMPGINQFIYEGEVDLLCDSDFEIIGYICCRSASFTNIFDSQNTILSSKTYIHSNDIYCNNSPIFNSLPVAKFCSGQLATYNINGFDIDGDSLVYELVTPYTHFGYPTVMYIHGYDYNTPLPIMSNTSFDLDIQTGELNFYPFEGIIQNAVIGVMIYEYRNGILIGQYIREIIFNILANCDNKLPVFQQLIVNGVHQTNTEIIACENENLNLEFTYSDLDSSQILSLNESLLDLFPQAIITESGYNPIVLSVFIPASDLILNEYNFNIKINDNACPINGFTTKQFKIKKEIIDINPISDTSICIGENVSLYLDNNINSPYTYIWNQHNTLSCSNCNSTIANPLQNTIYTGNISGLFCNKTINIEVTVNSLPVINLASNTLNNNIYFSWNTSSNIDVFNVQINNNTPLQVTNNEINFLDLLEDTCIHIQVEALSIHGCISSENLIACSPVCYKPIDTFNSPIICKGEHIELNLNENFVSYLWSNNATSNSIFTDGYTNNYSVTVTDNNQCSYTYDFIILYAEDISVNIETINASHINANNGQIIIEKQNSLSQYTYALNNGNIQIENTYSNLNAGSYILTVYDEYNCTWSKDIHIGIDDNNFSIPTAFSPNGDGENDIFRPINMANKEIISLEIYNRWGNLIFESSNNFAWDGTFKNEIQAKDIYIYVLKYKSIHSNLIEIRKGEFLLMK